MEYVEELNKSSPGPEGENNNFSELVERNTANGRKTNFQLQNNNSETIERTEHPAIAVPRAVYK